MHVWSLGWTEIHWHKLCSHVCICISRTASRTNLCGHFALPFINWYKQWVILSGSEWLSADDLHKCGFIIIRFFRTLQCKSIRRRRLWSTWLWIYSNSGYYGDQGLLFAERSRRRVTQEVETRDGNCRGKKMRHSNCAAKTINLLSQFTAHSSDCISLEIRAFAAASIECPETEQKHFAEWTGNEWNRSLTEWCRWLGSIHQTNNTVGHTAHWKR